MALDNHGDHQLMIQQLYEAPHVSLKATFLHTKDYIGRTFVLNAKLLIEKSGSRKKSGKTLLQQVGNLKVGKCDATKKACCFEPT